MISNSPPLTKDEVSLLPPLTLAYIGDAVFDLYIRETLLSSSHAGNGALHKKTVKYVSARGQADYCDKILCQLTDEETAIYKRGRNSHAMPGKNTDPADYHKATGIEALMGWLYLSGQNTRLSELLCQIPAEVKDTDNPEEAGCHG